jgi:hypothetical protein
MKIVEKPTVEPFGLEGLLDSGDVERHEKSV